MDNSTAAFLSPNGNSGTGVSLPGQVLLEGARDLLGPRAVEQLWGQTAGQANLHFLARLEERFGADGGRGLALRIGRAVFQRFLKSKGETAGLTSINFRLLPAGARMEKGLCLLGEIWSAEFADRVTVTAEESCWLWRVEPSAPDGCRLPAEACCYLAVGMLQEFLAWAGGGRYYRVKEIECQVPDGAQCVYQIDQKPVD